MHPGDQRAAAWPELRALASLPPETDSAGEIPGSH
jgi:hypothetical protein